MGGGGKGGGDQVTGYRYYAGLHLVFCHTLDNLLGIKVGDKWAWTGDVGENTALSIKQPELFGGDGREGGIVGTVDVCFGTPTQGRNSYLQSILGASVPAFRGLFGLVARKCQLSANNPYIKQWAILGRRTRTGWRDEWAAVLASDGYYGMNPAHIIRETLTNTTWGGLGYPVADIDDDSFDAAAYILMNGIDPRQEALGLNLVWAKDTSIEDFLQVVLNHIDGMLFFSHVTGKLKLKLVRNDYTKAMLPVINESNVIELVEYAMPVATEAVNQVTVQWVDRDNNGRSTTVQDISGISRAGGQIIPATLDYPGIATEDLAQKVAARELQQLCMPIASCTLLVNRKNWNIEPGDCFAFDWPSIGIGGMVMRVDTVEVGIHTDNQLRIKAARDVYGLGAISLTSPSESLWTNPLNAPADAVRRKVEELTWWQFVRQFGESDAVLAELDDSSTMVSCFCGRPSSDALNYEMWTRNAGGVWVKADTDSFPFTGTLALAVEPEISSVLQLQENEIDTDMVSVGTYAALGDELVSITAIDTINRTVTVNRGVLDTIPVSHPAGEFLWAHQGLYGLDREQRVAGEVVEARMLPSTSKGRLELDDASTDTITLEGRMMRPYPPGNVQINGARWPESIGIADDLVVTWAHRDRTTQTVTINRQDEGNIGPESGVTYSLRLYDTDTETLLKETTGITVTSASATAAEMSPTVIQEPYWDHVSLLLNCNGTDGSTVFTDVSPTPKTVTKYGNAKISTSQSKYGGVSAYFDGNGDYLSVAYNDGIDLLGASFTVEAWVYPTAAVKASGTRILSAGGGVAGWTTTTGIHWLLQMYTGNILSVQIKTDGSTVSKTHSVPITINAWNHISFCIDQGTNTAYLSVNGDVEQFTGVIPSRPSGNPSLAVATIPGESGATITAWIGYMDDIRLTKGVARYTEDFATPAAQLSQNIDFEGGNRIRVELESERDGLVSLQKWILPIERI